MAPLTLVGQDLASGVQETSSGNQTTYDTGPLLMQPELASSLPEDNHGTNPGRASHQIVLVLKSNILPLHTPRSPTHLQADT